MGRSRIQTQADQNRLLGEPSRLAIIDALAERPRLIAELTDITGLHRNTVRAHLERLQAAGLVQTERRDPIGPGRPAIRYRLHDELAPSGTEQRLLIQALVAMVARAYDDGAEELATAEGVRIGRELGTQFPVATAEEAIRQVTTILRRLAFSPELTSNGSVSRIALHSCPFEVRPSDPRGTIICSFHFGLIRGVLDAFGASSRAKVRLLPHVDTDLCLAEIKFA